MFFAYYFLYYVHHFQNKKVKKKSHFFCLVIEGSRSGSGSIPLTDGSGSRRPKNMWIQWIRIRVRNTASKTPYSWQVYQVTVAASLCCWWMTWGWILWAVCCPKPSPTPGAWTHNTAFLLLPIHDCVSQVTVAASLCCWWMTWGWVLWAVCCPKPSQTPGARTHKTAFVLHPIHEHVSQVTVAASLCFWWMT
jgi:hypothetical protein